MQVKYALIGFGMSAVIGGGAVYKYMLRSIGSNTETIKENVVTVIKEIKRLDGTVETETRIVDKSVSQRSEVLAAAKPDWAVGVGYDIKGNYSAQVSRRILGNIYVGVAASQNGTVAALITVTF